MQPRIAFCHRCRGMKVGWNQRYFRHRLVCGHLRRITSRALGLALLTPALLLAFPEPSTPVFSVERVETPLKMTETQSAAPVVRRAGGAAVRSIDDFLNFHKVRETNRDRLANSIVASAKKYDVHPRLVASILIVESRGNPFAISGMNAIGVMQIHLPTWGQIADREGINLFKIEDNVDFGTRILADYVHRFGLWEGVKRYNGFFAANPDSVQSAQEYAAKVQRVYEQQSIAEVEVPDSAALVAAK